MLCAARALSHLVYMLSQECHIPSLPHHAHVSERAKATLGVAEASELITRM